MYGIAYGLLCRTMLLPTRSTMRFCCICENLCSIWQSMRSNSFGNMRRRLLHIHMKLSHICCFDHGPTTHKNSRTSAPDICLRTSGDWILDTNHGSAGEKVPATARSAGLLSGEFHRIARLNYLSNLNLASSATFKTTRGEHRSDVVTLNCSCFARWTSPEFQKRRGPELCNSKENFLISPIRL